jgi:hypothetical protein
MKIADYSSTVPPAPPIFNDPRGQNKPYTNSAKTAGEPRLEDKAYEVDAAALSSERLLFHKLEGANEEAGQMAQQIRAIDHTIRQIHANVEKMQSTLETVTKVYPPYPKDSAERIEALRQFASLRKMIDQLTIPPREDSPEKIMGDTKQVDQAGQWEHPTADGQSSLILHPQPMHPGPGGLNLPELPNDASDEKIQEALDSVVGAKQLITQRRAGFMADANRVLTAIQ